MSLCETNKCINGYLKYRHFWVWGRSHFIHVVGYVWDDFFKSFSLSDANNKLLGFLVFQRHALDDCPMVKHVLGESLSLSVSSKGSSEAKGFRHWQISFNLRI